MNVDFQKYLRYLLLSVGQIAFIAACLSYYTVIVQTTETQMGDWMMIGLGAVIIFMYGVLAYMLGHITRSLESIHRSVESMAESVNAIDGEE